MSKKEDALYDEWVKERKTVLKGKSLEHFEALLSDDAEGSRELFRGGLRETDYYRRLNEISDERKKFEAEQGDLQNQRTQLQSWFETEGPKNERLLKEKQDLMSRVRAYEDQLSSVGLDPGEIKTAAPTQSTVQFASPDELKQLKQEMANLQRGLPAILAQYGQVIHKTASEKWNVDPGKVVEFAGRNNVDLLTAFDRLTVDEKAERETAKMAELEKKWKEEGKREALSQVPSPDKMRPNGPTIVDMLRDPTTLKDRSTRVSGAVQDFIGLENVGGMAL